MPELRLLEGILLFLPCSPPPGAFAGVPDGSFVIQPPDELFCLFFCQAMLRHVLRENPINGLLQISGGTEIQLRNLIRSLFRVLHVAPHLLSGPVSTVFFTLCHSDHPLKCRCCPAAYSAHCQKSLSVVPKLPALLFLPPAVLHLHHQRKVPVQAVSSG